MRSSFCSFFTQRRSVVCREEGEGSQSTAVKKSNIYREAFLAFLTVGWSVGVLDEYWNSIHQVYMNSGPELGCGHKISKVLRFRDGFELQLGEEETHSAKCSLPRAVNAVKGALINNSWAWKTYELVKLYSLHQTFVYALKCLNGSVRFTAFLLSFLQPEIQEGKLTFWL